MGLYEFLLLVHIVAVMIWWGGALVGVLIGSRLRAMGDAQPLARFCGAFAQIAGPAFGGSSMLVLISGAWMVSMDGGAEWTDLWVVLGGAGWLVAAVFGATAVGMTWNRAGILLSQPGASLDAHRTVLDRAVLYSWLDLGLRLAIIGLMVWRPV